MKKGFTLVELLIVVAILGILAAVGVVSYTGFLGSAKENTSKSNHSNVVSFIQTYWVKCSLDPSATYEDLLNSSSKTMGVRCDNDSWGDVFQNHFEGSGWKNSYDSKDLQVHDEANMPSKVGRTNIKYYDSENKITVNTLWGEGDNGTSSVTIYKEF